MYRTDNTNENSQRMRGWQIHGYGAHDKMLFHTDLPMPKVTRPSDVLVEVITVSVNQLDEFMIGQSTNITLIVHYL